MQVYKSAEGYEISPYKLTMYKTAYSVRHQNYVGIKQLIECQTDDVYLECSVVGLNHTGMFKTEELERFCL